MEDTVKKTYIFHIVFFLTTNATICGYSDDKNKNIDFF